MYSPWNGGPFILSQHVSGITYKPGTNNMEIEEAKALQLVYRIFGNDSLDETIGDWVDVRGNDFEKEVDKIGLMKRDDIRTYVSTIHGIVEESKKAFTNDFTMLVGGIVIIIIYLCISLGHMNRLNHKIWLSIGGIVSIGLGVGVSFAVCSIFGLSYGPVHMVIPYLLLGEFCIIYFDMSMQVVMS